MLNLFLVVFAYLLGSVSTAIILAKLFHWPNPQQEGSQNPGAANVFRLAGKKAGLLVFAGDALKGFIAVGVAHLFHAQGFYLALIALAAVLGHIFPLFFSFKGGKGVATTLGTLLVLNVWITLFAIVIWLVVAFLTRYASLASLLALMVTTLLMLFVHLSYFLPVAAMTLLIIWTHWENVERLKQGTENKLIF